MNTKHLMQPTYPGKGIDFVVSSAPDENGLVISKKFDVPLQTFEIGNMTGRRAAFQLLKFLEDNPHFTDSSLLSGILEEIVPLIRDPANRDRACDKANAAMGFMFVLEEIFEKAARSGMWREVLLEMAVCDKEDAVEKFNRVNAESDEFVARMSVRTTPADVHAPQSKKTRSTAKRAPKLRQEAQA